MDKFINLIIMDIVRFQDAAALTIFAGFIKIFKYISFNKTMSQLAVTISRVR